MTISIKHKFVNPKSDTGDTTVSRASNWNDEHDITLAQNRVLGRVSAANGPVEELTGEQIRTVSDVAQAGVLVGINTRTASYTLVASDRGKIVEMNVASANTVTVPNETGIGGVNYPIGTQIKITQLGTGQTTLLPAAGVTVRSVTGGLSTSTRYGALILYKRASNDWFVIDQTSAYLDVRVDALETTTGSFFYQGGQATNPSLRNDGTALQTGDLYFNTTNDRMRVYEVGTGWIDYEATAQTAATTATTQAGTATSAATTATTQANIAVSSATAATTARTGAEAALTAVQLYADIYPSVAAGLAATTNGQYFSVPASGAGQILTLYQNSSGTASLLKEYPSADAFSFLAPVGFVFSIYDQNSNAAIAIDTDGAVHVSELQTVDLLAATLNGVDASGVEAAGSVALEIDFPGYVFSVMDMENKAAFAIADDGTVVIDELSAGTFDIDVLSTSNLIASRINNIPISQYLGNSQPNFSTEINHIFTYGQSLSVGYVATPVLSSSQPFDSLKLNGGVRPHDTNTRTAFAALTETVAGDLGETPSAGTAHAIKELIATENNISYTQQSYQLLLSADGEGGQTIAALTNAAGTFYPRVVASMQAGFDLAQAAGKTYNVPAFTWTQGESDYISNTSAATYITAMETLRAQIQSSAVSICGQSNDVRMICYQVASHKVYGRSYPAIALAQLQASKDNVKITLATPTYHLSYAPDNTHLTATGSKCLGFYYGLAYKRTIIDGGVWKPVQPISQVKQGSILTIRFHVPNPPLTLDTVLVSLNTNYGFNLFDASSNPITISSVTVTGPDTVKIVAASAIPAGAKLQYAFYGAGTGGATGPRGNLRDSQGDVIVFDSTGLNYPAHNWCVMFELAV